MCSHIFLSTLAYPYVTVVCCCVSRSPKKKLQGRCRAKLHRCTLSLFHPPATSSHECFDSSLAALADSRWEPASAERAVPPCFDSFSNPILETQFDHGLAWQQVLDGEATSRTSTQLFATYADFLQHLVSYCSSGAATEHRKALFAQNLF